MLSNPRRTRRQTRFWSSTALIIGAAVTIAGCGSSSHTRTQTVPATPRTSVGSAPAGRAQSSAAPTNRLAAIPAGRVVDSFTGRGSRAIGSLAEKSTVVLEWRTSAPEIQIFTVQGFLLVDSHLSRGRVRLARGRYRELRVAAAGPWTIRLHAAA